MKKIENHDCEQMQDFNSVGLIKFHDINSKIITIRNNKVILDSDVAELYGVQTKEVNQAVRNNAEKFPEGYVFMLQNAEKQQVVKNFDHLEKIKFSPVLPNAFTERGLYMLATILKSPSATQTTIDIIETFAKLRELSREVAEIVETPADEEKQKSVVQKAGEVLSDIVTRDLKTIGTETIFELNVLTALKVKHTIKRERATM